MKHFRHFVNLRWSREKLFSVLLIFLTLLLFLLMIRFQATSAETDCLACHGELKKGKVVHKALEMGCTACHTAIDATDLPHKKSNNIPKGLSSREPELCYGCHDKSMFTKKTVHAALGAGCTGCHSPHASDVAALLGKEPLDLCLGCHGDVKKRPHAIAGFSSSGHPLGEPKAGKVPDDPARPGKKFYCGSCHTPHSSDYVKLFRYRADSAFDLCGHCHKM